MGFGEYLGLLGSTVQVLVSEWQRISLNRCVRRAEEEEIVTKRDQRPLAGHDGELQQLQKCVLQSLLFVASFTNTFYTPAEAPLMQKSLAVPARVTLLEVERQLPLC